MDPLLIGNLDYGIINPHKEKIKMRYCITVNHFFDVCIYTFAPSRNIRFIIIDQLNYTNSNLQMRLTVYCCKKKDFGFQRWSPYIKDLIAHMIGIENVQNALRKDRTYDNEFHIKNIS